LAIVPTANPLTTQSSVNVYGVTQYTNAREYLLNMGFSATTGLQGSIANGAANTGKVTLYVGMEADGANVGEVWAENPAVWLKPTLAVPVAHHQVSEMDMNNGYKDVDPALGPAGIQYPLPSASPGQMYTYGLVLETNGSKNTAAVVAGGTGAWHRGFVCDQTNAVDQSCFADYSTSAVGFDMWGTHNYGIDMLNSTASLAAMRVKEGNIIVSRNAGNTADVRLLGLDSSNNTQLGPSGLTVTPSGVTQVTQLQMNATTWANNQSCVPGQMTVDANYIYVCTAANVVKRAALSAF
jgi:rhodanese-related sulfurtransferase